MHGQVHHSLRLSRGVRLQRVAPLGDYGVGDGDVVDRLHAGYATGPNWCGEKFSLQSLQRSMTGPHAISFAPHRGHRALLGAAAGRPPDATNRVPSGFPRLLPCLPAKRALESLAAGFTCLTAFFLPAFAFDLEGARLARDGERSLRLVLLTPVNLDSLLGGSVPLSGATLVAAPSMIRIASLRLREPLDTLSISSSIVLSSHNEISVLGIYYRVIILHRNCNTFPSAAHWLLPRITGGIPAPSAAYRNPSGEK